MTNDIKVAAIVPAYNEEKTVGPIVRTLVTSPLLSEVIVVSDGSTDRTQLFAEREGARTLQLPRTQGKGEAMLHGVAHTDANVIVFFDADLIGLTHDHIERLVYPVMSGSRSMNVGIRDRGLLATKLSMKLPLIGGERAMNRNVIEGVPPEFLKGFMVEAALNFHCRSRGYTYGMVFLPGLTIRRKMQKVGIWRGMVQYVKMFYQVAKAMLVVRLAYLFKRF